MSIKHSRERRKRLFKRTKKTISSSIEEAPKESAIIAEEQIVEEKAVSEVISSSADLKVSAVSFTDPSYISFKNEYVSEALEELDSIDNHKLDFEAQGKVIKRWLYIVGLLLVNIVVIIVAYYLAQLVQLFRG